MGRRNYTLLQILYWCSAASVFCFSVSFLRARGFSNAEAGLMAALGNLVGLLLPLRLSVEVDRGRWGLMPVTLLTAGLVAAPAALLILHSGRDVFTGLCIVLSFAGVLTLYPLYIRLSELLQEEDGGFRFGLSRGMGSLAFALTAWGLGILVQLHSVSMVPYAVLGTAVLQFPVILFFRRVYSRPFATDRSPTASALIPFLRRLPRFSLFLLGIALIFAANNTVNNFLINVVENVKGDYADLGRLTFFSGIIEFPAMYAYGRLSGARRGKCLRLSLVFFPVKLLAIALARNLPLLFAAYFFHALSFGLYTPAVVDYVERTVPAEDLAKGQSLQSAVASLGTMVATLTGGVLLDSLAVQQVLLILAATAALGAFLGLLAARGAET